MTRVTSEQFKGGAEEIQGADEHVQEEQNERQPHDILRHALTFPAGTQI